MKTDDTLYFKVDDFAEIGVTGHQQTYTDWVHTRPGCGTVYAPDYTGSGDNKKAHFFSLQKTEPDVVSPPKKKTDPVDILFVSGNRDLLKGMLGDDHQVYNPRTMKTKATLLWDLAYGLAYRFKLLSRNRTWEQQKSAIYRKLNDANWKISKGDDPGWYYKGSVHVEEVEPGKTCDLEITADLYDPWKYEKYSSMDVWLWDDFSFIDGIIRDRDDYTLSLAAGASKTITIPPRDKLLPVYLRSNKSAGASIRLKSSAGDTGTVYTVKDTWIETGYIPTEESCSLTVKNESGAAVTVEVYYRGAML